MQIILVSRHLRAARTVTIMPCHLAVAGFAFVSLVIATAGVPFVACLPPGSLRHRAGYLDLTFCSWTRKLNSENGYVRP